MKNPWQYNHNMKPILIIKNVTAEGAGLIEDIIASRQIAYEIVDLEKGQAFTAPQNYSAIIVCGGPYETIQQNKSRRKDRRAG